MRALPWLVGGGAAAFALYYWRERKPSSAQPADGSASSGPTGPASHGNPADSAAAAEQHPAALPGRWVWPVGIWQGRKPVISDGYRSQRRLPSGEIELHGGVDLMYRRQPGDPWRAGTPNGTPNFVMPDHRAALAASDGKVSLAAITPRGWSVIVDHHPRKLVTYYTHLASLLVKTGESVAAGAPLGSIGADPLDAEHIMHLHFEVWPDNAGDPMDPQPIMESSWQYLPDPGDVSGSTITRNAGHRSTDGAFYVVPVKSHTRRLPRR